MSRNQPLLKASVLLFAGSMASNICNYIFQIIMGRWLSVEDYGIMNSLIALFMIIAVPGITISMVMAKYTSVFKAKQERDNISGFFYGFLKAIVIGVSFCFLVFLILSPYISSYLNISSVIPTIILGIGLLFAFLLPINQGLLQGLQQFSFLSFSFGLGSLLKLLFAFALVYLGFRVSGVMTAVALSTLIIFLITFFYIRMNLVVRPLSQSKSFNMDDWQGFFKYIIPVLTASLIFSILSQADMVLVKHYFSAQEAGLYASAAVLGRAILYLPAAIVIAIFPMVSELHSLNQNSFHILNKGLTYTVIIAGGGTLLFWIMPEFLLGILFGQSFVAAAPVLRVFGLAMFPLAILGILINFNLARNHVKFIYPLFLCVFIQIGLIHCYHQTLSQVLWIIAGMGTFMLITNFGVLLWEKSSMVQAAIIVEERT